MLVLRKHSRGIQTIHIAKECSRCSTLPLADIHWLLLLTFTWAWIQLQQHQSIPYLQTEVQTHSYWLHAVSNRLHPTYIRGRSNCPNIKREYHQGGNSLFPQPRPDTTKIYALTLYIIPVYWNWRFLINLEPIQSLVSSSQAVSSLALVPQVNSM